MNFASVRLTTHKCQSMAIPTIKALITIVHPFPFLGPFAMKRNRSAGPANGREGCLELEMSPEGMPGGIGSCFSRPTEARRGCICVDCRC